MYCVSTDLLNSVMYTFGLFCGNPKTRRALRLRVNFLPPLCHVPISCVESMPCTTPYNTAAQRLFPPQPENSACANHGPSGGRPRSLPSLKALTVLADEPVISLNRISLVSGVYKFSQDSS